MRIIKYLHRALMGWSDPDFYRENRGELYNTNYRLLRIATFFSVCMCAFLFVLTRLNALIAELSQLYVLCTVFFVALALVVHFWLGRHRGLVPLFFYIFAAAIFALVIFVGTFITPDLPAVTFYVFLLIIPILFVTRPIYAVCLSAAACAAFCIVTSWVKGPDSYLAQTDMLNALCCCIIGVGFDITIINLYLENIRSKALLRRQSATDELTGLPNRRSLDQFTRKLFQNGEDQGEEAYFFMMDIDNFKEYNDAYGHMQGDECLRRVSRALESTARIHDIFLCRFGGEEFVAVFVPKTREEVHRIAQRFVDCVAQLKIPHKAVGGGCLTISLGYVGGKVQSRASYRRLLDRADTALYSAKAAGKNRAVLSKTSDG